MRLLALAFAVSMAPLSGCSSAVGDGAQPEVRMRETQVREEAMAALAVFWQVWEETENPFEARRQAKTKHLVLFVNNPVLSRNLDALTALMWTTQGGEWIGAMCYMRGFQFGTALHDQCVYEGKMGRGEERQAVAPRVPRRTLGPVKPAPAAPPVTTGQGGKVYSADECIGPVIIGTCHGSILPNKAYHPTCHGTWLAGRCTGPMF